MHRFATTELLSTYLVALVAGPYADVARRAPTTAGSIPRASTAAPRWPSTWTPSGCSPRPSRASTSTTAAFGVRYPFGKYDQLFVPEFNAGAMENAGAVTFREDYVFRSRVTRSIYERRCRDHAARDGPHVVRRPGHHALVGRPVAERVVRHLRVACSARRRPPSTPQAWTTFANVEKCWAYRQDQLPSTHPIAADIPDLQAVEVNFDGITYAKGASVLKQLVAYVGLEPFLAGLRAYFEAHAWGNATFDDLLGALEQASGRDLSGWGAQWLQHHRAQHCCGRRSSSTTTARSPGSTVVQGGARPGSP